MSLDIWQEDSPRKLAETALKIEQWNMKSQGNYEMIRSALAMLPDCPDLEKRKALSRRLNASLYASVRRVLKAAIERQSFGARAAMRALDEMFRRLQPTERSKP